MVLHLHLFTASPSILTPMITTLAKTSPTMTRPALHLQTKHLDPPPPSLVVSVHSLTAKFSLNRPESDLVPTLYLRKADHSRELLPSCKQASLI